MFDIFRWSKYKPKHKNTEKHQNKAKKIKSQVIEKYRPLSKDEQESVAVLPPLQEAATEAPETFNDLENKKETNLDFEYIQNKRINKFKNDGKIYFDDDNKTKITLNLTAKRVSATTTPLNIRESEEQCANINARQRESVDSATGSPIDVETALKHINNINEIVFAKRDGNVHSHSQSKNSRNELAERQGHALIGNNLLLLKNKAKDFKSLSKTKNLPIAKDIVVLDTTKPTLIPLEQAQILNEVKIRKNTNTHERCKSKRQSWLGGLHLLRNKNNNAQEQHQNTTSQKKTEGALRKIFFLRKSKSIDNGKSFADIIDKPKTIDRPNQAESVLKKPQFEEHLEEGKDFRNEISMARGRNHNRLRNNHSQQQQQQQQQQQHHHQNNDVTDSQDNLRANEECVAKSLCNKDDNMTYTTTLNVNENEPANGVVDSLSLLHSTHLETIYDPANKSTNSYQITASNNSNRNAKSLSCAQLSNSAENKISQPDVKGENSLSSKVLCAEALIQSKSKHFAKDQPQLNCILEQRNTLTPIIDRHAFQTDIYLNNSANTIEELQPTTENADTETDSDSEDCEIVTNVIAKDTDAKNKLNELTECDRDHLLHTTEEVVETLAMGQTSGKQEAARKTRASTPQEFRESVLSDNRTDIQTANIESNIIVPTITVVDYSHDTSADTINDKQNVFCEFKTDKRRYAVDDEIEKNSFSDASSKPIIETSRCQNIDSSYSRLSHVFLDDVPEQEEFEEFDKMQDARNGLSTSFPDSGIGLDSFASNLGSSTKKLRLDSSVLLSEEITDSTNPSKTNATYFSKRASSVPMSHSTSSHRMPFIRDGYSTDCDDTLMQCDEFDFVSEENSSQHQADERLVCIESISLPDVVVESTANISNGAHPAAFQSLPVSSYSEQHVSINGATGNKMENIRFVPIRVEGSNKENKFIPKRYSIDDSGITDHHGKSTIEITSEDDENYCMGYGKNKGSQKDNHMIEKLKCDLVSQQSNYNTQLEDAQKKTLGLQTKVNEMQTLIDTLEKDLATKTWNVEKLQAELNAAHKDDEFVRKRLKLIEEEKTNLRHKYCDNEDELKSKYDELHQKYMELEEKYKTTQQLASNLQTQLAGAQSDAEECREQMNELREEMEEHMRLLKNALEYSEAERKIGEDKWQKEFEMLRTHNQDREETLMTDCEWQLRQMQKQCKDKIDKAVHSRKEAVDRADLLECAAQERLKEMQQLRLFEAEAKSLRGLTSEQDHSILSLTDQLESLKADLKMANDNLEDQIEAVRKIKYQCDNKIYDKERELIQRIDYVRNEAASFWENKLYTEMTRLKSELESVFIDERREALDKLQTEHIEELRALTTRYTANEEELRTELAELQERFDQKSTEYLELREKSDNALLQTRMHLDRADRDYQNAMSREEEKREALEESLHEEFEAEKIEMEEKFRERLEQVKDEFSRELQMSTQEMKKQHKKELAQQKARLQAEKDEAMHELVERHRSKLADAEDQIKDIELSHQRDLKDLKAAYDTEKSSLDKRDLSNANEIEQLHRKCRCLTNLFEEMRVRYERRDPRPEDLREITELRSRCESHERDLYLLTDRLREMQMQMEELQQRGGDNTSNSTKKNCGKAVKKPPPKTIPTSCDVIYEENEERDSPPPTVFHTQDSDGDEDEEENNYENGNQDVTTKATKLKTNGHDNSKCGSGLISEDDGHMITAV